MKVAATYLVLLGCLASTNHHQGAVVTAFSAYPSLTDGDHGRRIKSPAGESVGGLKRGGHSSVTSALFFAPMMDTGLVDINEGVQRDIYTMEEWAVQYGVQRSDGFQLTMVDNGDGVVDDYIVITTENLAGGSPVVFVPNQMLLASWQAPQEFGNALDQAEGELSRADLAFQIPLFRLFVKILAEYEKGMDSPWFPWLNSLPRRYNNGASMTYACFDCLPPYVAWLSMTERTNCVNFQKAAKLLQYAGVLRETTALNTDLLKWAYSVATTRSFDVPDSGGEKVIAPMADFFNHGTETEVDYQLDQDGNFMVYAIRDVPAGSPLRISLGDPTNPSPLLATYGFLDESSPATFCKIMNKRDEMAELNLNFSNLLFYKDTGEVSPEVWDLLLYSILKENDPGLQRQFYQAVTSGDEATKNQFHQQYFQYTLEALKNHVDSTLRDLDSLSIKALGKDPSTHPRIPVILKHNDFNKSTFLKVKANLDNM
jgi:SET domain